MGFFDAYGVNAQDVNEDPFSIPKNTYNVQVSKSEMTNFNKDDGPMFFQVEFTIVGGEHAGKSASDSFRMVPYTAADREDWQTLNSRTLSNYKKLLLNLGMKPEALGAFDPKNPDHRAKLLGIKGTATLFTNSNGYNSARDFVRTNPVESAPAEPIQTSVPEAGNSVAPDQAAMDDLLSNF